MREAIDIAKRDVEFGGAYWTTPRKFRPLLADLGSRCYAETHINGVTKRTRVTCPWETTA
jgi:hypothetical protein